MSERYKVYASEDFVKKCVDDAIAQAKENDNSNESVNTDNITELAREMASVYTWEQWDANPNIDAQNNLTDVVLATAYIEGMDITSYVYADSIKLSAGKFVLKDPISDFITVNTSAEGLNILCGKYVSFGTLYYIPEDAQFSARTLESGDIEFSVSIVSPIPDATRIGVVTSDSPYDYPNDGEKGGFWYISSRQRGDEKVGSIGSAGGYSRTLLWENPDQSHVVETDLILTLDELSECNGIEFGYFDYIDDGYFVTTGVIPVENGTVSCGAIPLFHESTSIVWKCKVENNTVSIVCRNDNNRAYVIPLKIWGYKYSEYVEPNTTLTEIYDELALRPAMVDYATKNLVNVADTEVINDSGEFSVSVKDNRYTFTKLLPSTRYLIQKVGNNFTVPKSGSYTFTVFSNRNDLGSSVYAAVYNSAGNMMGYGFVNQDWQHSVVMILEAGTEYYYSVNTNYTDLDTKVEIGETLEFWLQIEAGESSTEWIAPVIKEIPSVYENAKSIMDLRNINEERYPLNPLLDHARFVSAFNSICCMGDSLTNGVLDYNDHPEAGGILITGTSYPEYLAIMTGKKVHNCGYGGATALNNETAVTEGHSYVDIANTKGWFSGDFLSQAYIIALGTNDFDYYGGFSGDVGSDINTTDYTKNAKTSVGGYASIIQRILAAQPKAKIFCVTLPKSRNVGTAVEIMEGTNNKIKAIAELFGCYVIDLYTYAEDYNEVSEYKLKYYTGYHLNSLGYQLLARRILTYMEWIIRNNTEDFRNISLIGTGYEYDLN